MTGNSIRTYKIDFEKIHSSCYIPRANCWTVQLYINDKLGFPIQSPNSVDQRPALGCLS